MVKERVGYKIFFKRKKIKEFKENINDVYSAMGKKNFTEIPLKIKARSLEDQFL